MSLPILKTSLCMLIILRARLPWKLLIKSLKKKTSAKFPVQISTGLHFERSSEVLDPNVVHLEPAT